MQVRARRVLSALALAGGLATVVVSPPAQANIIDDIQQRGLVPGTVYVVKDLGGGAYWNVTTSSMYAVQAGSEILISGAQTTADLLATAAANGRDLLLLINGAVLQPVQNAF